MQKRNCCHQIHESLQSSSDTKNQIHHSYDSLYQIFSISISVSAVIIVTATATAAVATVGRSDSISLLLLLLLLTEFE